ncbi:MAG: hypothetical protein ACI9QL_000861 [Candidatus Omnitrophota bacterium]|jgi:hypothetical protein
MNNLRIAGLLLSGTLYAEPFVLIDIDTGQIYGPVEMGDHLKIDGKRLTVAPAPDPEAVAMGMRLRNMQLKNMVWEDASVNDLFDFIVAASRDLSKGKGVNITVQKGFGLTGPATLTISRDEMAAYELLELACAEINATMHIKGNVLRIEPKPQNRFPKATEEKTRAVKNALRGVIIPELSWENASLAGVTNFLMHTAKQMGKPIAIVVDRPAPEDASEREESPPPEGGRIGDDFVDDFDGFTGRRQEGALITLSLRQVSMFDTLIFISEIMETEWYVGEKTLIILQKP